jgi:ribonuclease P protein component
MLPKSLRLSAAEVKEVLAKGKSLKIGPFTAKYLDGRSPLGVAVIVSKKTAKKATERNSLRRKVYLEIEKLPLPPQGALAVFVRK